MNDVFISYNFEIKDQVEQLNTNLKQFGFKIWYDEKIENKDELSDKSFDEIAKSKLFLCCLTQPYFESDECNKEINLADKLYKPIIILMVQNLNLEIPNKFNKGILTESQCMSFNDSNNWLNDNFIKIKDQIHKSLGVYKFFVLFIIFFSRF
jgi:hypothetical protein